MATLTPYTTRKKLFRDQYLAIK